MPRGRPRKSAVTPELFEVSFIFSDKSFVESGSTIEEAMQKIQYPIFKGKVIFNLKKAGKQATMALTAFQARRLAHNKTMREIIGKRMLFMLK